MPGSTEKPTPVMIEKKLAAVERLEAALSAIEAVDKAGGTAAYRSVNLLDHEALAGIVAEIRQAFGRIDVLVHAGGIEISKALNQKDAAQFDLVQIDASRRGCHVLYHCAENWLDSAGSARSNSGRCRAVVNVRPTIKRWGTC